MQNVRLFHLAEQDPQADDRMALPICLGHGMSELPMHVDLAALPHLLVAGRTEGGTTACLHSIIVSILKSLTPEQVRLILIDPNKTVFSRFGTVPHLMLPVVADLCKADAILGWAVEETERRHRLFAESGVRRLDKYNRIQKISLRQILPRIVIIADEMTDLVFSSIEAGKNIARLAQNRPAVGIHLVLATRISNVNTVAGYVKSQIPTRIALAVVSEPENRDALDREIDVLLEGFDSAGQAFEDELVALKTSEELHSNETPDADPLYDSAVEYVVQTGRCSLSSLCDRFGIGYGRAAHLIDRMEKADIVGCGDSEPFKVLLTPGDWRNRQEKAAEIETALRTLEETKQKLERCLREAEEAGEQIAEETRRILDRSNPGSFGETFFLPAH